MWWFISARNTVRPLKKTPALLLFPEPQDLQKCGCELFFFFFFQDRTKTVLYIAGHVPIRHARERVFIGIEVALPTVGLCAHREPVPQ